MKIPINGDSLDAWAKDAGLLANLLKGTGKDLELNAEWFENPLASENIGGAVRRPEQLLNLLADFLGDPEADPPNDDYEWYPVTLDSDPTGLYVVLSKDHAKSPAFLGLGLWTDKTYNGPPKITATAYFLFPLFSMTDSATDFVLGKAGHPVKAVGEMKTDQTFEAGGTTYQTLRVAGNFYFDGTKPGFEVSFLDADGGPAVAPYTALEKLLKSSATDWIDAVLSVKPVKAWLNAPIGSSAETPGKVLATAKLLAASNGDVDPVYKVADLKAFLHQKPLKIAENLAFEALNALAGEDGPLIKVGDGGIYIVKKESPDYYGVRVCLPDVGKSAGKGAKDAAAGSGESADSGEETKPPAAKGAAKNRPQMVLQVGKWFTGEDEKDHSWLKRADEKYGDEDPGVFVYLLQKNGAGVSFKPRVELVSVGFDYVGGNDKPLVDVKGFALGGFEPRVFAAMDLNTAGKVEDFRWGGGVRLDQIGIPLAGNFDQVTGDNPVASNLLASGDGKGGDAAKDKKDAVNPAFSASASYVDRLNVQLYGPDDAETERVWFPVQRAFGPLACKKLGVEWKCSDRFLSVLFQGGVSLGPLAVDLLGLSVGMSARNPTDLSEYKLGLDGLAIAFKSGGIEITGGFLKNHEAKPVAYDGQAYIKTEALGIGAFGSYTTLPAGHDTSLFVFAFLDQPIGGPGFFFVTGLAAGFGYNRDLRIPAQDEVQDFPLVAALGDSSKIGGPDATPGEALAKLSSWVPPTRGQYWIAAGLKFTTYEVVNSRALLVVKFGEHFEIDILGLSTIKLPQAGKTYVYAELQLEVVIDPDDGVFGATLVLSPNSYVLDPKCALTGGFAFFAWFGSNPYAGDFVITLGGYHPAFEKPAHYPDEPRLGFNWEVGGGVSIKGGAYFALTPSCAMAGGRIEALYHSGDLKAWFIAHADIIIFWKPFYFDAAIGISIGASYRMSIFGVSKTFKVELGADLELWGPPTGGKVHVSWFIISFTVGFGADKRSSLPTIDWKDFKQLLPQSGGGKSVVSTTGAQDTEAEPHVVSASVQRGLLSQEGSGDDVTWFVRPQEFMFSTKTTIPGTGVVLGKKTVPPKNNAGVSATTSFGVRPMGIETVDSAVHTITIEKKKDDSDPAVWIEQSLEDWEYDLDLGSVPDALWGPPLHVKELTPSHKVIENCIIGVKGIHHKKHGPLVGPPVIDAAAAFTVVVINDDFCPRKDHCVEGRELLPLSPDYAPPASGGPVPSTETLEIIQKTLMATAGKRTAVFNALAGLGVDAGANGDLAAMAKNPGAGLEASPMVGTPVAGS